MQNPAIGVAAGATGSTLVVCNSNSAALNTPGDATAADPWIAWATLAGETPILSSVSSESGVLDNFGGDVPNSSNIRPIDTPFGQYLNLYHVWRGDNTVTQAPRIQVFGKLPPPRTEAGGLKQ